MTDLKRLRDWHESEGSEFVKVLANGDKEKLAAVANHAETARILSVLEAVRGGHKWTTGETDGSRYIGDCYMHIKCTPGTLRALAELLGGGK